MNQKNSFLVNGFKWITRKQHEKTYGFVSNIWMYSYKLMIFPYIFSLLK
ncbi:Hypothetical protein Ccan_18870 [Capnocytophaga canimorsus Cc5]|uniref:Uncharacterized protein n=1 Tax=Capnocytophaga canimorsus (strain 5) TaxID=860228 RepID=F9YT84_CAPCC|nr:Hypothetical protein Ccan_18870 [Capnocytophaga canimorsus Cc5]